ncbi:class I SAM-dependent methyltransferase [Pseudomonas piscis]|uniref:Methyltransferase domain-containing protein n=1 Tax=Pseudomonas piscis TaxID=2614538 RepID=A0A7X1PJQ8_9PSED|nr:class I SAM-dependent methyltransferase [Pseudomonas piscis]MQA53077.1 methyltransferase domain-containing protein [Pseudomonas piscis]
MGLNTYFDRKHLEAHYATTEDYKQRSESWETLAKHPISQWYAEQLKELKFTEVLDAGAGLGRFSDAVARSKNVNITAIDISPEMVRATRERVEALPGNHRFIQSSIEEAPFEKESFDLILANLVLHHVPDIKVAFEKLATLVKPGGHISLLTADFDWMNELNRLQDHALVKLGFPFDGPALIGPGTNSFCDANIMRFAPASLTLVKKPWFDGTMVFPDEEAVLNFYTRTLRYKNIAQQIGDDSLKDTAHELIKKYCLQDGELKVSSSVYQYVFKKI